MNARAWTIALLAFIGMIDTIYLSLKRDAGTITCHVTQGCNDVLTSRYSELAGIPISWFGFAFYVGVFSLVVFAAFGNQKLLQWIFWPAAAAFLISIILTGIQAFILRAYCEYCLGSAGLVTAIFLLTPRSKPSKHPG